MYCASCGSELSDPRQFCPSCGASLAAVPPPPLHISVSDIPPPGPERLAKTGLPKMGSAFRGPGATASGRVLSLRFVTLGDMRGKTEDEIIAAVGPPSSVSSMTFGQSLLQWQATGYHIALLFDAERRFVKVTHEYAHQAPAPPSGCMIFLALIFVALTTLSLSSFAILRAISD